MRGLRDACGLIVAAILLAACTGSPEAKEEPLGPSRAITREQYNDWTHGSGWPLTIDKITLSCKAVPGESGRPLHSVVVTDTDGNHYALNGTAGDTHLYRPAKAIWAQHEVLDMPKDTSELIALGLVLCGGTAAPEYWPPPS